ncbi:hypothetical protein SAMN06295967_1304 [Belliella buryatensis]|uniref:Uncharacterized protein n=1 Tax=Belliella buryatensis TaxID=1500549 RepID=A0A239H9L9_9BACT|nr:hypothetical protein [Belliella buryatensis]SNS77845.1 hypothetical protein SAMN06295967_1304 [Belliella buryatensis]
MKILTTLCTALFVFNYGLLQAQTTEIIGYTSPNDIEIIDDINELSAFQKGDLIFSKARGLFAISPINNINNRAINKLKTEASMRGASHIYINYRNIENSTLSKSAMYSARVYKGKPLNFQEINQAVSGKKLIITKQVYFSRNDWKANEKEIYSFSNISLNEPVEERNGKVFIKIRSKDYKSGKLSSGDYYEVVGFNQDTILIFTEEVAGKEYVLHHVKIE